MNFYLLMKMKGGGALVHVYVWNTESALTTESLDGYLPNLVGIKSTHDPSTSVLTFGPNPPSGG